MIKEILAKLIPTSLVVFKLRNSDISTLITVCKHLGLKLDIEVLEDEA